MRSFSNSSSSCHLLIGCANKDLQKIDTLDHARGQIISFDPRDKYVAQSFLGHFDSVNDLEVIGD